VAVSDLDSVWSFLREFFNYAWYDEGVERARAARAEESGAERWQRVRQAIAQRELPPGEPLRLVNEGANQVLDANTDEEAYKWLDLMLENVESDGQIRPY